MFRQKNLMVKMLAVGVSAALILPGTAAAVFSEEVSVSQETGYVPQEEEVSETYGYAPEEAVLDTETYMYASEEAAPEQEAYGYDPEADPYEYASAEYVATEEEAAPEQESAVAGSEGSDETSASSEETETEPAQSGDASSEIAEASAPEQDVYAPSEAEAASGSEESAEASAEAMAMEEIPASSVPGVVFMTGSLDQEAVADSDAAAGSNSENRGVYYYRSKEDNADITDTYIYDDELLKGSSLEYNAELATMSLSLVNASIASTRADFPEKSRNLQAFLEDNGFTDFEANEDYKSEPTLDTMGVACAHKKITDNGKTYTLLVIAPRSAGYKTEWGGNFAVGTSGDHEGFTHASDIVLSFAKEYVEKYGISGDIKVWTAGGSRGAGVINVVGAHLLNDTAAALGDAVTLTPDNLYCYTFGTPRTADSTQADLEEKNQGIYAYIHNLSEPDDVVGTFVPEAMGFTRYGDTREYTDPELKEKMLSFLRMTSEAVYQLFSRSDPDNFESKVLDFNKLVSEKKLEFVPASENNYLSGMTQADYMRLLEGTMNEVFGDRETYVEQYQEPMQHFFGYVYGGSGELGTLFQGVKGSDFLFPTIGTMYISVVLEAYMETYDEKVLAHMNEVMSDLEATINDYKTRVQLDEAQIEGFEKLKEGLAADMAVEADQKIARAKDLLEKSWALAARFYSKAMEAGLAPVKSIDDEKKAQLTSEADSLAMVKVLGHILLVDPAQTEEFGFGQLSQQFAHLATTLANAKSFMTPHYNEVILSWLRAEDPNYEDVQKADNAQATGYRRIFVEQPDGVDVTGTVKDSAGNVVAVFKNGELVSRTNKWIGMTTSDEGNWLRLPVDDTYKIDFEISEDTTINVKVSEYSVEKGDEVRVETSDANYSWKDFAIRPVDSATLVISAVDAKDGVYTLDSGASYYFDLLKRFYVTFALDGGTLNGTSDNVREIYDGGTDITLPTPSREGYTFAYWEESGKKAGGLLKVLGDHIFKAIWEKIVDDKPAEEDPEDPENPEDVKPEKPEETDPDGPTCPEEHWWPGKCWDPEEQSCPEEQTYPGTPVKYEEAKPLAQESVSTVANEAQSSDASVQYAKVVNTADEAQTGLWLMLMMLSVMAAAAGVIALRVKRQ